MILHELSTLRNQASSNPSLCTIRRSTGCLFSLWQRRPGGVLCFLTCDEFSSRRQCCANGRTYLCITQTQTRRLHAYIRAIVRGWDLIGQHKCTSVGFSPLCFTRGMFRTESGVHTYHHHQICITLRRNSHIHIYLLSPPLASGS